MFCARLWGICLLLVGSVSMAIEEPAFEVVKKFDDFELRKYSAFLIAETTITGTFDDAGNQAFDILAGYIQGENVKSEEIEMTAPVNQQPASGDDEGEQIEMTAPVIQVPTKGSTESDSFVLSFVMPAEYTMESLPKPKDARVHLREVPARLVAVRLYGGNWSRERYEANEKKLLEAVKSAGYETIGVPNFARYNPPFMPSLLRRNEVMIEVKDAPQDEDK